MNRKTLTYLITITILILPIISNSINVIAEDYVPRNINLTCVGNTSNSIMINWITTDITTAIVQYGLSNSYGEEVEETHSDFYHHVEITGLEPKTTYHYRVGNGEIWSEDLSFTTGSQLTNQQFIWISDAQEEDEQRKIMVESMKRINSNFLIFGGDFVDTATNLDEWNSWFRDYYDLITTKPVYTILGNHEKNTSIYYDFFALPGMQEYYSFDYGAIHFSVLHTFWETSPIEDYTIQSEWLSNDLNNSDALWNIILMHRPPFDSYQRYHQGYYDLINESFVPIFEEYNVDLVLTGHDHGYERLFKNNVSYIVSGGGGGILYNIFAENLLNESVTHEKTYNFLYLDVREEQLDVRALREDYSLIDQLTINNNTKSDLRVETLPLTTTMLENESYTITIKVKNIGDSPTLSATTVELSSGMLVTTDFDVPILQPKESVEFTYTYEPLGPENRTFTISLDKEENIDELIEDNNEIFLTFRVLPLEEPEPTTDTPFSMFAFFSSILILILYKRRKNRKK